MVDPWGRARTVLLRAGRRLLPHSDRLSNSCCSYKEAGSQEKLPGDVTTAANTGAWRWARRWSGAARRRSPAAFRMQRQPMGGAGPLPARPQVHGDRQQQHLTSRNCVLMLL